MKKEWLCVFLILLSCLPQLVLAQTVPSPKLNLKQMSLIGKVDERYQSFPIFPKEINSRANGRHWQPKSS